MLYPLEASRNWNLFLSPTKAGRFASRQKGLPKIIQNHAILVVAPTCLSNILSALFCNPPRMFAAPTWGSKSFSRMANIVCACKCGCTAPGFYGDIWRLFEGPQPLFASVSDERSEWKARLHTCMLWSRDRNTHRFLIKTYKGVRMHCERARIAPLRKQTKEAVLQRSSPVAAEVPSYYRLSNQSRTPNSLSPVGG